MTAPRASTISSDRAVLGFWIYILSDCLLFGALFATFAVLRAPAYGSAGVGRLIFDIPFVLIETLVLLSSSFTIGLAILAGHAGQARRVMLFLAVTALLGCAFVGMELTEFSRLIAAGHDWTKSGFLSAFFTLVGTHGLHVAGGILWMLVMLFHIGRRGLTPGNMRRLLCLSLFWHFLDIIWVCIFTIVYLMGVL